MAAVSSSICRTSATSPYGHAEASTAGLAKARATRCKRAVVSRPALAIAYVLTKLGRRSFSPSGRSPTAAIAVSLVMPAAVFVDGAKVAFLTIFCMGSAVAAATANSAVRPAQSLRRQTAERCPDAPPFAAGSTAISVCPVGPSYVFSATGTTATCSETSGRRTFSHVTSLEAAGAET